MEDKEQVVGRLEGKTLKTFRLSVKNAVRVQVEAFDEDGAEAEFKKITDEHYDWPWENAEDYDGWEIDEIEEV